MIHVLIRKRITKQETGVSPRPLSCVPSINDSPNGGSGAVPTIYQARVRATRWLNHPTIENSQHLMHVDHDAVGVAGG
jgi:hypothetical protein